MHTNNDPALPDFATSVSLPEVVRKIMTNVTDTVFILGSDLRPAWTSRPGRLLLGLPIEEWGPRVLRDRVHPEDLPRADRLQKDVLADSGAVAEDVFRVSDGKGGYDRVHCTAVNKFGDPDINGVLVTVSTQTELRDQSFLGPDNGRGDLFDHVIHEVRACGDMISEATRQLSEAQAVGNLDRTQIGIIDHTRSALSRLTVDAVDLSSISNGTIELESAPFIPSQLVDDVAADTRSLCSARGLDIGVRVDAAASSVVIGDPVRLHRILNQLVQVVAVAADGGSIVVDVSIGDEHKLHFRVHHEGPTAAEPSLTTMLDPLTAARREPGSQIGLAVARQLIELMDGSLGFETSDHGTAFWFDITFTPARRLEDRVFPARRPDDLDHAPPAPADAQVAEPADTAPDPSPESPCPPSEPDTALHVLVVDDSDVNRLLATSQLRRLGHSWAESTNGHEALERLTSERFDAVLMDWHMPGMDGLEATRRWRAKHDPEGRLPIISMTASAMSGDRERCFEAGASDYLSKPVSITDLGSMLVRWSTGNAPRNESGEEAPITEASKVDQLIDDLGDVTVVHSIVEAFIDMVPQYRAATAAALEDGDRASIRRHAHTLKSTAIMLGTDELATACITLEEAASTADAQLEGLVAEFSRCCREAELTLIDLSARLVTDEGHPL